MELMKQILTQELMKLAELCLRTTYFLFSGKLYKQIEGTAMGSPLSPLAAEIFMEDFEKRALSSADLKPRYWFRYVDDTFVVRPHRRENQLIFFQHLNKIHENIKFTI